VDYKVNNMPSRWHRRFSVTGLVILSSVLGMGCGYWLGLSSLLRSAKRALAEYAQELIAHTVAYGDEAELARVELNARGNAYCSAEDIAAMWQLSFRSLHIKDLGRVKDGKIVCSGFLGKLDTPIPLPLPFIRLQANDDLYNNLPRAVTGEASGILINVNDIYVVTTPYSYAYWERPHTNYMVVLRDMQKPQVAVIGGKPLDVNFNWVRSGVEKQVGDLLYHSECTAKKIVVCAVTTESRQYVLEAYRALLWGYTGMGGIAGFGLGLAIALFYLQQRGLGQQLRRALQKNSLHLVYQPIFWLPSRSLAGVESLLRWSDEDGHPVPPDLFVRLAEEQGFIGELTAFVIRRSLKEMGEILRSCPGLKLGINVAAPDLKDDWLIQLLDEQVVQSGIAPNQVALELTERSTADLAMLREAVLRLHDKGYRIHIDDFGTGFSNLSYLHTLPVDTIKIDRSFTRMIGNEEGVQILPQIINLARSLRIDVIVEGIETEDQAAYVGAFGETMQIQGQGWAFAKAVPAKDLPSHLNVGVFT
jgi:sensor c-di-GMP phosphodiesterase-like protein